MAIFSSGSALFNEDSDLVSDKKKSVSKASVEKKETLTSSYTLENFNPAAMNDADTYLTNKGIRSRLSDVNREGYSVDAPETSLTALYDDAGNPTQTRARQAGIIAEEQGITPASVSDDMILARGSEVRDKALNVLEEGQTNLPERGQNQFNVVDPISGNQLKQQMFPNEGPTQVADSVPRDEFGTPVPQIGLETKGELDYYDRTLTNFKNPVTGKDLMSSLNNRGDNFGFEQKYNANEHAKEIIAERAQANKEREVREKDSWATDNELNSFTGYAKDVAARLASGTTNIAKNILKAPLELVQYGLEKDISPEHVDLYASIKAKEQIERDYSGIVEKKLKALEGKTDNKSLAEVARLEGIKESYTLAGDELTVTPAEYNALEKSGKIEKMSQALDMRQDEISSIVNRSEEEKVLEKPVEELTNDWEEVKGGFSKLSEGDILKGAGEILGAGSSASAEIFDFVVSNPKVSTQILAESLPEMYFMVKKMGTAAVTMLTDKQDTGKEAFVKREGRQPTKEESQEMLLWNTASVAADIGGAELLLGKIVNKAKYVETDIGKGDTTKLDVDKMNEGLPETVDPSHKLAQSIGKVVANPVTKAAGKVTGKTLGEFGTEGIVSATEQRGEGLTSEQVDVKKVAESGLKGAAGGGVTSVGTDVVGLGAQGAQKATETATKIKESVSKKPEKSQKEVNQITNRESSAYNSKEAYDALRDNPPEKTGKAYVKDLASRVQEINQKAKASMKENGVDSKETRELVKDAKEVQSSFKQIQDSIAKKAADSVSKAGSTEAINEDDVDTIKQDVIYGSKNLKKKYSKVLDNKNVPTELKELLNSAIALEDSIKDYNSKGKDKIVVGGEVLGTGTNKEGKKSVGAHLNGINYSIAKEDKKESNNKVVALNGFIAYQKKKIKKIQEAINKFNETGVEQVVKLNDKKEDTFTFKVNNDNKSNPKVAQGFVNNTLTRELEVLQNASAYATKAYTETFDEAPSIKDATIDLKTHINATLEDTPSNAPAKDKLLGLANSINTLEFDPEVHGDEASFNLLKSEVGKLIDFANKNANHTVSMSKYNQVLSEYEAATGKSTKLATPKIDKDVRDLEDLQALKLNLSQIKFKEEQIVKTQRLLKLANKKGDKTKAAELERTLGKLRIAQKTIDSITSSLDRRGYTPEQIEAALKKVTGKKRPSRKGTTSKYKHINTETGTAPVLLKNLFWAKKVTHEIAATGRQRKAKGKQAYTPEMTAAYNRAKEVKKEATDALLNGDYTFKGKKVKKSGYTAKKLTEDAAGYIDNEVSEHGKKLPYQVYDKEYGVDPRSFNRKTKAKGGFKLLAEETSTEAVSEETSKTTPTVDTPTKEKASKKAAETVVVKEEVEETPVVEKEAEVEPEKETPVKDLRQAVVSMVEAFETEYENEGAEVPVALQNNFNKLKSEKEYSEEDLNKVAENFTKISAKTFGGVGIQLNDFLDTDTIAEDIQVKEEVVVEEKTESTTKKEEASKAEPAKETKSKPKAKKKPVVKKEEKAELTEEEKEIEANLDSNIQEFMDREIDNTRKTIQENIDEEIEQGEQLTRSEYIGQLTDELSNIEIEGDFSIAGLISDLNEYANNNPVDDINRYKELKNKANELIRESREYEGKADIKEGFAEKYGMDSVEYSTLSQLMDMTMPSDLATKERNSLLLDVSLDVVAKKDILEATTKFFLKYGFPTAEESTLSNNIDPQATNNSEDGFNTKTSKNTKDRVKSIPSINNSMGNKQGTPISVFGLIPNLFSTLQNEGVGGLIKKVLNFDTDKHTKSLNSILKFYKGFSKALKNDVVIDLTLPDGTPGVYAQQLDRDPTHLLRDEEGNFQENVVAAISTVAMNWIGSRSKESIFNGKEKINAMFGRKDTKADLPTEAFALLSNVGMLYKAVALELGRDILKQLNITADIDADGNLQSKLEEQLGNLAIATLVSQNLLEIKSIDSEEMDALRTKEELKHSRNDTATYNFVRIPTVTETDTDSDVTKDVPNEDVQKIVKQVEASKGLFSEWFNIGEYETGPTDTPSETIPQKMKGTINNVSSWMKKNLLFAQKLKWTPNSNVFGMINKNTKKNILLMNGYIENIDDLHVTEREGAKSKNELLLRELEAALEYMKDRDIKSPFHFAYKVWKNLRSGIVSNTVNPQNSKMHRFMFGVKEWTVSLNLKNSKHTDAMKLAVAEAFGVSVDKTPNVSFADETGHVIQGVLDYFDNEIVRVNKDNSVTIHNPKIAAAIQILRDNPESSTAKLSKKDQETLLDGVKEGGEKMHSLSGLMTLADYVTAVTTGKNTMTSNLPRETDGITNGIITGLLQMAPRDSNGKLKGTKDKLNKGGIFFKGNHYTSYSDWKSTKGNRDSYEGITIATANELGQSRAEILEEGEFNDSQITAIEGLAGKFIEKAMEDGVETEEDIVTKEGRDFSKNPLMISAYGASIAKIVESMSEIFLKNVYSNLVKYADDYENPESAAKLDEMVKNLNAIAKDEIYDVNEFTDGLAKEETFTKDFENEIKQLAEEYYGAALSRALEKQLGNFTISRAYMNAALTAMSEVFVFAYNKKVDELTSIKGSSLSKRELGDVLVGIRDAGLLPGFAHYSSEDMDTFSDFIQVTKYEDEVVSDELGGALEQSYKKPLPTTELALDEDGDQVYNETTVSSKQSNVVNKVPTSNISVGGFIQAIISVDGSVNGDLMGKLAMLNVFDAGVYSMLDTPENTTEANFTYDKVNFEWSAAEAIRDSLSRFSDALINNFNAEEQAEINENIKSNVKVKFNEDTTEKFDDMEDFTTVFNDHVDGILDNRIKLFKDITVVEQFAEDGAAIFIGDTPFKLNKNREDVNKNIDETVNEIIEEVIEEDNQDRMYVLARMTKNKSGTTLNQRKLSKDDKAFYLANKAEIDNILVKGKTDASDKEAWDAAYFSSPEVETFNATYDGLLTSDTAKQTFDDLEATGNVTDSTEHKAHLTDLLESLIIPVLQQTDGIELHTGTSDDVTKGKLQGDVIYMDSAEGIQKNNTEMSSQEVLTHELTHAIWKDAINDNPWVRKELKRLFRIAEKSLTWEDLMKRDADGNVIYYSNDVAAEEQAAKDLYDYIFNTPNETAYLHEFATFGLTNEPLINALKKKTNASVYKELKGDGVVQGLKNLFHNILSWFMDKAYKSKSGTVDVALRNLANNTTKVNNASKSRLATYIGVTDKVSKYTSSKLQKYVIDPYTKSVDSRLDDKKNPVYQIAYSAYSTPRWLSNGEFRKQVNDYAYSWGWTKDNFMFKLLREIGPTKIKDLPWKKLLRRGKKELDNARQSMFTNSTKQIEQHFSRELTEQEWEILNGSFLKTDLSLLLTDYTPAEILNIMENNTDTVAEIRNITKELQSNFEDNSTYYIEQAKGLAYYMVTGKVGLEHQSLNANNIALLAGTGSQEVTPKNVDAAAKLIDKLTTLYSIQELTVEHRKITAGIMREEINSEKKENGVDFFLNTHRFFKEDSLAKNFNQEEYSIVKGYTHENYDSVKSVLIAPLGEKAAMRKDGYTLVGKVEKDPNDPNQGGDLYLYSGSAGQITDYQSGIVNLANERAMGQNLVQIYSDQGHHNPIKAGKKATSKITKRAKKGIKGQFNGTVKLDRKANFLLPTIDSYGDVQNYRYVMSEVNKKQLMGKKDLGSQTLGRMLSNVDFKENKKLINKQVLELAKKDADMFYTDSPREFVKIGIDSTDKKYSEFYAMMPSDMKRDLKDIWGGDNMYIRTELLDMVMGYSKLSFTNWMDGKVPLPRQMKSMMRHTGIIWKAVVGKAKRNIVILTPAVLIANHISNSMISMLKGMPPNYILQKQSEALLALEYYQDLIKQRDALQGRLNAYPNSANTTRLELKIQRLSIDITKNPVHPLINEGIFQSIVEDVEVDQDSFFKQIENSVPGYQTIEKFANKGDVIFPAGKEIYKQITIAPDTTAGNVLMKATQYSDFIARYAMYDFLTKHKNVDKQTALQEVVETFVDYEENTSRELQWLNDMGIMMFTKFLFRIQRVILKAFKEQPASTVLLEMLQSVIGDIDDILDSNLITNTYLQRLNVPGNLDTISDAATWNAFNYVPGLDLF